MSIMQDKPSPYTSYARSLCPSWCVEDHVEQTDPNDASAVHHRGPIEAVTVTSVFGTPSPVEVRLGYYNSLTADDEEPRTNVTMWSDLPDELSAADAVQVAQLLIHAAEAARRG